MQLSGMVPDHATPELGAVFLQIVLQGDTEASEDVSASTRGISSSAAIGIAYNSSAENPQWLLRCSHESV